MVCWIRAVIGIGRIEDELRGVAAPTACIETPKWIRHHCFSAVGMIPMHVRVFLRHGSDLIPTTGGGGGGGLGAERMSAIRRGM